VVRKYRSRLALGFFVAALSFTFLCLLLPQVKTEQTVIMEGPTAPYGNSDYTFSGYLVPPVDAGSKIIVAVNSYIPKALAMSIFAAKGGDLTPTGSSLLLISNFTGAPVRVSITAPPTGTYAIFVVSSNRTNFLIGIKGTWSLFYVLRLYVVEGIFASLAGAVSYYYARIIEKRLETLEGVISSVGGH